jgi:hypothetical protein
VAGMGWKMCRNLRVQTAINEQLANNQRTISKSMDELLQLLGALLIPKRYIFLQTVEIKRSNEP